MSNGADMENTKMKNFHAGDIILREVETYYEMYKVVFGSGRFT